MAAEYKRSRGRKKIILPSGNEIYIPALTGISLVDPRDRYQEHQYSIDNSPNADRDIHVDDVYPVVVDADGKPTSDPPVRDTSGDPLKVERIDTWRILDPRSRYQEHHVDFDNKTGADTVPPSFTQHQKTHIYRYYKDPESPDDNGPWIDSELIDELATVDPRDRYQETAHAFNNPTNAEFRAGDLSGQASSDDPDITNGSGEGTADTPVRLDPFQNIINFHDDSFVFYFDFGREYSFSGVTEMSYYGPNVPGGQPAYPDFPTSYWAYIDYMTSITTSVTSTGKFKSGRPLYDSVYTESPGPAVSIDPSLHNFDDWTVVGHDMATGAVYVQVNLVSPDADTPGDPLVINGETIPYYTSGLQAVYQMTGTAIDLAPDVYRVLNPPSALSWINPLPGYSGPGWYLWESGGSSVSGASMSPVDFTITVSPDPFTFRGGTYKAVGIANDATVSTNRLSIYCVPA